MAIVNEHKSEQEAQLKSKRSNITFYDIPGSIKNRASRDIDLPAGSIPVGFEILIVNKYTGEQHREYWLDSDPEVKDVQTEWIDKESTEFVALIKGKLDRFKIVTRVYYFIDGSTARVEKAEELKVEHKRLRMQFAEASIKQNITALKVAFIAENELSTPEVWNEKLQQWGTLLSRIESSVNTLIEDQPATG